MISAIHGPLYSDCRLCALDLEVFRERLPIIKDLLRRRQAGEFFALYVDGFVAISIRRAASVTEREILTWREAERLMKSGVRYDAFKAAQQV